MRTEREAAPDEAAVAVSEVTFVMDRFGYCKILDKTTYDRNKETVETENPYVVNCLNTDKICIFTNKEFTSGKGSGYSKWEAAG